MKTLFMIYLNVRYISDEKRITAAQHIAIPSVSEQFLILFN